MKNYEVDSRMMPSQESAGISDKPEMAEDAYEEIQIEKTPDLENSNNSSQSTDLEDVRGIIASSEPYSSQQSLRKTELLPRQKIELRNNIETIRNRNRFALPAVAAGNKTATEYDSKVRNFSTVTNIVTLSDGEKLFVVYNYSTSRVHRALDGFMKKVTGCRMKKADFKEWKGRFEQKSRIPTIECEDENMVVLPFLPNVNAYDLFANRDAIKDFGECDFAETIDANGLLDVLEKVVVEIQDSHANNITWGELILPNIIVDKDQSVHICDPETSYDSDVPMTEQKARDLLDLIISSAAALEKEDVEYSVVAARILNNYQDKTVIKELQKLAQKKPGILERVFFGYTKARLGLKNSAQWKSIKEAIANYYSV
jgi:tRNA A-37 threonylcarbamoyl transferase component Bud32